MVAAGRGSVSRAHSGGACLVWSQSKAPSASASSSHELLLLLLGHCPLLITVDNRQLPSSSQRETLYYIVQKLSVIRKTLEKEHDKGG